MAKESLNLKHAKRNLGFFSNITKMNKKVKEFKLLNSLVKFTQVDEGEISRGSSYAMFPELIDDVNKGGKVTIKSFRQALDERDIDDLDFQNKVLYMVLQTKIGLQFGLGAILIDWFNSQDNKFAINQDQSKASLEVTSNEKVTFIFKFILDDITIDPRKPAISALIYIDITPQKVAITDFNITQISDTPNASDAYQFLKDNQQNILEKILEKILSYFKQLFDLNNGLELEKDNDENFSWSDNTNKLR
ncbi:hypothetical protein [Legionella sp.]|uniref:hypothetical protein n=1 Tax=Legionella sp. TaxID=459 RepID=UPI003C8609B6